MKTKLQIIQEKRGEYTRKRRKKYLRAKHIRDNMPKKKKVRTFPLEKAPSVSLDFSKPPAEKKLSWWKRLWNYLFKR